MPCLAGWIRGCNARSIAPLCPTCNHPLGADPDALRINTDIANAIGLMMQEQTSTALLEQLYSNWRRLALDRMAAFARFCSLLWECYFLAPAARGKAALVDCSSTLFVAAATLVAWSLEKAQVFAIAPAANLGLRCLLLITQPCVRTSRPIRRTGRMAPRRSGGWLVIVGSCLFALVCVIAWWMSHSVAHLASHSSSKRKSGDSGSLSARKAQLAALPASSPLRDWRYVMMRGCYGLLRGDMFDVPVDGLAWVRDARIMAGEVDEDAADDGWSDARGDLLAMNMKDLVFGQRRYATRLCQYYAARFAAQRVDGTMLGPAELFEMRTNARRYLADGCSNLMDETEEWARLQGLDNVRAIRFIADAEGDDGWSDVLATLLKYQLDVVRPVADQLEDATRFCQVHAMPFFTLRRPASSVLPSSVQATDAQKSMAPLQMPLDAGDSDSADVVGVAFARVDRQHSEGLRLLDLGKLVDAEAAFSDALHLLRVMYPDGSALTCRVLKGLVLVELRRYEADGDMRRFEHATEIAESILRIAVRVESKEEEESARTLLQLFGR